MRIELDEATHTYSVNGEIATISVTELLHKHGLAPSYKGVSKSLLKKRAEEGRKVHKDLENVLNTKDYEPTTQQGKNFAKWVKERLDCGVAEQPLAIKFGSVLIAGTADLMGFLNTGETLVADHKNTASYNEEYVSWQTSLIDYMARKNGGEEINGNKINWRGAKRFMCFQYDPKTGALSPRELQKVEDSELERLLQAEAEGKIYKRKELTLSKSLREQIELAEMTLSSIKMMEKSALARAEELRGQLIAEMEAQGIKSWETENVKVTYVEPTDRIIVDSTKLRRELPEIYGKYSKTTRVKANVRITIKGGIEDGEDF